MGFEGCESKCDLLAGCSGISYDSGRKLCMTCTEVSDLTDTSASSTWRTLAKHVTSAPTPMPTSEPTPAPTPEPTRNITAMPIGNKSGDAPRGYCANGLESAVWKAQTQIEFEGCESKCDLLAGCSGISYDS